MMAKGEDGEISEEEILGVFKENLQKYTRQ